MPPTAVRVFVDGSGDSIGDLLSHLDVADLEPAPTSLLEEHHQQFDRLVPKLLEAAKTQASFIESTRKKEAHKEAEKRLMGEAQRLRDLSAVNPSVKPADVEAAEAHAQAVLREITRAEMRLEGVRLVVMGRMAW